MQPALLRFFRLLAYTGLRSSEALGLRWSDINIFNSTLSVRRTVTNDEHWGVVIDTPKTAGSTRTIDLDSSTIELLQSWHKSNDNKVITLTNRKNYVFFNATRPEGVFIHQDARYWDKSVCHKYGLRYITPTDLDILTPAWCLLLVLNPKKYSND